jgi:hypothetical protein
MEKNGLKEKIKKRKIEQQKPVKGLLTAIIKIIE